jgi:hypothetical protein
MKASELTKEGWYWNLGADRRWNVVYFGGVDEDDRSPFSFTGSIDSASADEMPGEFFGPLKPPTAESDRPVPYGVLPGITGYVPGSMRLNGRLIPDPE